MNDITKTALIERLTALADDELILAHRNSEWTGHAPILEEDIAVSNIAQDELGHATVWLGLVEELTGRTPDDMAFLRPADDFLNVQMVELPRGDWAFTMLRQYLFDAYEHVLIEALLSSKYPPLAAAAAKFRAEEMYHLRHTHLWVERLGLGTAESNRRMQAALDELWPAAGQLFVPLPGDDVLIEAGFWPDLAILLKKWRAIVVPHLEQAELVLPQEIANTALRSYHTVHLAELLDDMQQVARRDPEADW